MQALLWKIHNMFQLFFAKAWIKSEYSQEIVKLNQTIQHYTAYNIYITKKKEIYKKRFFPTFSSDCKPGYWGETSTPGKLRVDDRKQRGRARAHTESGFLDEG